MIDLWEHSISTDAWRHVGTNLLHGSWRTALRYKASVIVNFLDRTYMQQYNIEGLGPHLTAVIFIWDTPRMIGVLLSFCWLFNN